MSAAGEISPRELEVVTLVVDGRTNAEIAQQLGVSIRTAQQHVAVARRKLGARSRTQLAVIALRRGLVPFSTEDQNADG